MKSNEYDFKLNRLTKNRIENRFGSLKGLDFIINLSYEKYMHETTFDPINEVNLN